jgi:murein DD-endopeptidase MepM/ murein hydrolase activator NlpD
MYGVLPALLPMIGVLADAAPPPLEMEEPANPLALGMVWPVEGEPGLAFVESGNPIYDAPGFHPGVDLHAPPAAVVVAALAGEVVFAGDVPPHDTLVVVRHHDGPLLTYYAHLFRPRVEAGDVVETGQVIGQVGESSATGEYLLHFEVRFMGLCLDPLAFLPPPGD